MTKPKSRKGQNKREIAFEELQAIAKSLDFFRTPSRTIMVRLPEAQGRAERADSQGFREYLMDRYWKAHQKPVPKTTLDTFIATTQAHVRLNGVEREAYVRVAFVDGAAHLDLGGREGQLVRATEDGWGLVQTATAVFIRPAGQLALPLPTRGGSLSDLWALLNIPEADRPLLAAWMVSALLQDHPMALVVLEGPEGSGKSAAARFLKELLDPQVAPLSSLPSKGDELFLSAEGAAILAFDNLSGISGDMSDYLCRLLSGGGVRTRLLYSQSEERVFAGRRPIILNGITAGVDRADLLSRAIVVRLPRIEGLARRQERELDEEFKRIRPGALGALLDLVSTALRLSPTVETDSLPRLADFAVLGTAIETAIGLQPGGFIPLLEGKTREAASAVLGSDPLFAALVGLAEDRGRWEGTIGDLEEALHRRINGMTGSVQLPKGGPALGRALKRLDASLAQHGVLVARPRTGQERRVELVSRVTGGQQ